MAFTWRPGRYLRSSGALFAWLAVRAVAQAVAVVVLSRALGAADYGRTVAVLAVASFLTPLAGMGMSGILLRDGARNPAAIDGLLRLAISIWALSTAVCGLVAVALAWWLLPRELPWVAAAAAIVTEVAGTSLIDLLGRSRQARDEVGAYGALGTALPLARALLLAVLAAAGALTLVSALYAYAVAAVACAALGLFAFAPPGRRERPRRAQTIREAMPFAIGAMSMRLQSEFNKPVLARGGFELAGNFSAAQRAVELASLPLLALQEALWPRYYASGPTGRNGILVAALVGIALLGGACIWLGAPVLALLLGDSFKTSVEAVRWLAWLPLVQLARNVTNARSAASHQTRAIGWAYGASAAVGVATTLVLIPAHGVLGAVIVSYGVEFVTMGTQWVLVRAGRPPR